MYNAKDFFQIDSHSPEIRSHLSKAPRVGDPKQENSIPLIGTTWTTNFVENNVSVGNFFRFHILTYKLCILTKQILLLE